MAAPQMQIQAIQRPRFRFVLVSLSQTPEDLSARINELGSEGCALAVGRPVDIGESDTEQFLIFAQTIGVDIIGPGLLG
jgi:hypothetical protein